MVIVAGKPLQRPAEQLLVRTSQQLAARPRHALSEQPRVGDQLVHREPGEQELLVLASGNLAATRWMSGH